VGIHQVDEEEGWLTLGSEPIRYLTGHIGHWNRVALSSETKESFDSGFVTRFPIPEEVEIVRESVEERIIGNYCSSPIPMSRQDCG